MKIRRVGGKNTFYYSQLFLLRLIVFAASRVQVRPTSLPRTHAFFHLLKSLSIVCSELGSCCSSSFCGITSSVSQKSTREGTADRAVAINMQQYIQYNANNAALFFLSRTFSATLCAFMHVLIISASIGAAKTLVCYRSSLTQFMIRCSLKPAQDEHCPHHLHLQTEQTLRLLWCNPPARGSEGSPPKRGARMRERGSGSCVNHTSVSDWQTRSW